MATLIESEATGTQLENNAAEITEHEKAVAGAQKAVEGVQARRDRAIEKADAEKETVLEALRVASDRLTERRRDRIVLNFRASCEENVFLQELLDETDAELRVLLSDYPSVADAGYEERVARVAALSLKSCDVRQELNGGKFVLKDGEFLPPVPMSRERPSPLLRLRGWIDDVDLSEVAAQNVERVELMQRLLDVQDEFRLLDELLPSLAAEMINLQEAGHSARGFAETARQMPSQYIPDGKGQPYTRFSRKYTKEK